jgi:hypothetical protein
MTLPNWPDLFDLIDRRPGVPAAWFSGITGSVTTPLQPDEISELAARDAPDPSAWRFPTGELPPSYRAFLGWSNGGTFIAGEREFGMLAAEELRPYMLDYALPYHLPGAMPFALDGTGGFYLLDMRQPPDERGEYPVLHATGGDLGYDAAIRVAESFPAVFHDRTPPRSA